MARGDHVVERMDALEDHDLILAQLEGLRRLKGAHAAGEFVLRHMDALAAREHREVLVHQLHIQAERAFQVVLPFRRAGRGLGADGVEVVVHAHVMAADAAPLQRLGDLHGRRRLAGARRPGQQHNGAVFDVVRDLFRRRLHVGVIDRVALLDQAAGVRNGFEIDFRKVVCHVQSSRL